MKHQIRDFYEKNNMTLLVFLLYIKNEIVQSGQRRQRPSLLHSFVCFVINISNRVIAQTKLLTPLIHIFMQLSQHHHPNTISTHQHRSRGRRRPRRRLRFH
jgi:hypothetical protein